MTLGKRTTLNLFYRYVVYSAINLVIGCIYTHFIP